MYNIINSHELPDKIDIPMNVRLFDELMKKTETRG